MIGIKDYEPIVIVIDLSDKFKQFRENNKKQSEND